MLRSLRHKQQAPSQGHQTIDRLEDGDVKEGGVPQSSLKGQERAIIDQINISNASDATLGKFLREGMKCTKVFMSVKIHSPTELN